MKLTKREARFLLHHGATGPPFEDAFQRVLDHDWSFDPRGSNLTFLLRHFHETETGSLRRILGLRADRN